MGLTIDINKDYSRVAWTSPNTSGTITPLVALNDSNLFKSMLKTCDAFKIHSVWCTAFVTPANTNTLKHIVTFSDRTGIEDELILITSAAMAVRSTTYSTATRKVEYSGTDSLRLASSSHRLGARQMLTEKGLSQKVGSTLISVCSIKM